jgi:hypothetical protein
MKNKIKQNLNPESETRILDFDGGNAKSIVMLMELASDHSQIIDVTVLRRNNPDITVDCLLANGFERNGSSFRKDNLFFNVLQPPANGDFIAQIEQQQAFDMCIALDESLSEIEGARLREITFHALANCSAKMLFSLAATDMYWKELGHASMRGVTTGEITRRNADGIYEPVGLYDIKRINHLVGRIGIDEPETFIEEPSGMIDWVRSGFKTKTHGVVSNGKATRLDGRLIKREL